MAKTMIDCKIITEQNNGVERKFNPKTQAQVSTKIQSTIPMELTGKTTLRTSKSHIEFIRFFF